MQRLDDRFLATQRRDGLDEDGVGDNHDAFPTDPSETFDRMGRRGDNADAFPWDPTESSDSDGDGGRQRRRVP